MDIMSLIKDARAELRDVLEPSPEWDIAEIKQDGWWGLLCIGTDQMTLYSAGGEPMVVRPLERRVMPCILVVEWMERTHWALMHPEVKGTFQVHDVMYMGDTRVTDRTYINRRGLLRTWMETQDVPSEIQVVRMYSIRSWKGLWRQVEGDELEGLVFKSSQGGFGPNAHIGRKKLMCTRDYVVMSIEEGEGRNKGRMGSLTCGMYLDGVLTKVTSVGIGWSDQERQDVWDHPEQYQGRVLQVKGFPYGVDSLTVRHPAKDRWRDDKAPRECKPRTSPISLT